MQKPILVGAMLVALVAFSGRVQSADNAGGTLTFYGVEMKREAQITFKEFSNYARSHGQANYVLSKSPFVDYDGTGDVILASYGLDHDAIGRAAAEIPSVGSILEIRLSPVAVSEKRGVKVFKLPLLPTENSMTGDIWVQAGNNPPQPIEKNVILSSKIPNVAGLFKFVGFTDKEGSLIYCLDNCTRYDLVNGGKSDHKSISTDDIAGIHRSVEGWLSKETTSACKGKMTADFIQGVDKNGYYRGFCKAKAPDSTLEMRLKKDSGRWKVVSGTWEK